MKLFFIGNSYTYFNDLPKLVADMLAADGLDISYESCTAGGYTLERHIAENDFPALLAKGGYDYVILQEQSVRPASEPEKFLQSAKILCDMIKAGGATPIFYETWARRDGSDGMEKKGWTNEIMGGLLRDSYKRAADDNGALIAFAGDAFHTAYRGEVGDAVYNPDGSHPSEIGSQICAAEIYKVIKSAQ